MSGCLRRCCVVFHIRFEIGLSPGLGASEGPPQDHVHHTTRQFPISCTSVWVMLRPKLFQPTHEFGDGRSQLLELLNLSRRHNNLRVRSRDTFATPGAGTEATGKCESQVEAVKMFPVKEECLV